MARIGIPVVENTDPLPATAAALLRYAIGIAGPYAVARGWVSAESLPGIVTLVISAVTVIYGLYRTHRRQTKLVTVRETGAPVVKA